MASRTEPRVLITGASGFLGRHLLEALEADPGLPRPLALVRDLAQWRAWPWVDALGDTQPIEGSLESATAWRSDPRLRSVETIVHLAAHVEHSRRSADAAFATNVGGTRCVLELARALGARTVLISTSGTVACFRTSEQRAYEGAPYCEREIRRWPYYASKMAAEREAKALADGQGTRLVIVRPPVLLGPDDHRLRSVGHVLRVVEGRLPLRPPGGFAFVDVRDAARAIARLLALEDPRPVYHLPGTNQTLEAFFETVARLADRSLPRLRPSGTALRALARALDALPQRLRRASGLPDPVLLEMSTRFWGLGSHYAAADLGHRPRPAEETLRDTLAWLATPPARGAPHATPRPVPAEGRA